MVVRSTVLPAQPRLGAAIGWVIWRATGVDTWEVLTSRTHQLSDIPSDGMLAIRIFYEKTLARDETESFSDVVHGWPFYGIRTLRERTAYEVWRGDDETELQLAVPRGTLLFTGGLIVDQEWIQARIDLYSSARARNWAGTRVRSR